ncbi:hypothetical protein TNCV_1714321 [Trichonephila clavipes]|nr:hypothetical protein TNCV_1714321 [Trichonephila clavipes]
MATESVAENDTLTSLPEPDIDQKNLKNENEETGESSSEARIQDDALSVSNIEPDYRPEVILNSIFTAARANIPPVTRFVRHRVPEDYFYRSNRRRYQRNRWQDLKKRILMRTKKIRNSQKCLFVLIPLLGLPISAIIFSLIYIMECRKSTTILVFLNGIVGLLLIICRILTLTIRHFWTSLRGKEPKVVTKVLFMGLIALFLSASPTYVFLKTALLFTTNMKILKSKDPPHFKMATDLTRRCREAIFYTKERILTGGEHSAPPGEGRKHSPPTQD